MATSLRNTIAHIGERSGLKTDFTIKKSVSESQIVAQKKNAVPEPVILPKNKLPNSIITKPKHIEDHTSSMLTIALHDFEPEPGLLEPRILGQGAHGIVTLYHYKFYNTHQANPAIEKLCNSDGLVAIKMGKDDHGEKSIIDEQAITDYLYKQDNTDYNCARAANCELSDGSMTPVILTQYAAFYKNLDASTKAKSRNKSYSLKAFLDKLAVIDLQKTPKQVIGSDNLIHKVGSTIEKTCAAIQADLDIITAQLTSSMMTSIRALHANGALHLDIAPRNFLMKEANFAGNDAIDSEKVDFGVMAADFGSASKIDPLTGRSEKKISDINPLRWIDLGTLHRANENHYTPRTDLYAFRISLINIFTLGLGYENESQAICFNKDDSSQDVAVNIVKNYTRDSDVLKKYMGNLAELIAEKKAELLNLQQACFNNTKPWLENLTAADVYTDRLKAFIADLLQQLSPEQASDFEQRLSSLATYKNTCKQLLEYENMTIKKTAIVTREYNKTIIAYLNEVKTITSILNQPTPDLDDFIAKLSKIERLDAAIHRTEVFANSYQQYITNTPWDTFNTPYDPNLKNETHDDYIQYLKANERFFIESLDDRLLTPVIQPEAFWRAVKRCFALKVSKEFANSAFYLQLQAYINQANPYNIDIPSLIKTLPAVWNIVNFAEQQDLAELEAADVLAISHKTQPLTELELEAGILPSLPNNGRDDIEQPIDDSTMPPLAKSQAATLNFETSRIERLSERLDQLSQVFKHKSRYYHRKFYLPLKPLRHLFIKNEREIFINLQELTHSLQDNSIFFKKYADLMQLFKKDNQHIYKQVFNAADSKLKKQLSKLKFKMRSFYGKYNNYQAYILSAIEMFELKLARLPATEQDKFITLAQDFAEFRRLLLTPQLLKSYPLWLDIKQHDVYTRAVKIAEKIQQREVDLTVAGGELEFNHQCLILKEQSTAPLTTSEKFPRENNTLLKKSAQEWRDLLSKEKDWKLVKAKNNDSIIVVQPKKTKLNFLVDVNTASLVYDRKSAPALSKKAEQATEEQKLIAAMVKAFLKTGNKKVELTGSKLLCEQALYQLKVNTNQLEEIKVNGVVVYAKNLVSVPGLEIKPSREMH